MKQLELIKGRYELLELAGRGAQGEVWQALDHQHQRPVAIKIRLLRAHDRARLLAEARVLLDLHPHPGLPLLREDFFDSDHYYLVMDWIAGTTLRSLMDSRTAPESLVPHLTQVAETLDHLHSHVPPVVHKDVKPSNIVVTDDGRAVLVDFGISGSASPLGTPGYMAPELAHSEATPAADIFSLAATAFHVFTGQPPRPGARPNWSEIPKATEVALSKGLAFDPAMRPSSGVELMEAIAARASASNLALHASRFIGREQQLSELIQLVSHNRMLTIAGPGGMGKTRLAEELAGRVLNDFRDGAWIAHLAGLRDEHLVPQSVVVAAGITDESDTRRALQRLAGMDTLIVLDNCEHLLDACRELCATLLGSAGGIRIIATSRSPLGVDGEVTWRIPPLAEADSLRLFEDRASRAKADFRLKTSNLDAVIDICKQLEGIPLALELAAARIAMMGPSDIAKRLSDRLTLLKGAGDRRSLRETLDWSHGLLTEGERIAFRRISVFSGGFRLDAAELVTGSDFESIGGLVDKSLITFGEDGSERFGVLETVREYSLERLEESDEAPSIRKAHLRWLAAFLEDLEPQLAGPDQIALLDRIEEEHDNIRAALDFSLHSGDADGMRLVGSLWRFWMIRGHAISGIRWASRLIERFPDVEPRVLARALRCAGSLALEVGDFEAAKRHLEAARQLAMTLEDKRFQAAILNALAVVSGSEGDLQTETNIYIETLEIWRELDHARGLATTLGNLGTSSFEQGRLADARRYFEESLTIHSGLQDQQGVAASLNGLGLVSQAEGDHVRAADLYQQALSLWELLGHRKRVGVASGNLAVALAAAGKIDDARARFAESISILREVDAKAELEEVLAESARLG